MELEKYPHWTEKVVSEILAQGDERIVLSTAKTPSGPIHVGVGRELVYCSVFQRLLEGLGGGVEFLFFVDDFDSLKTFPPGIPEAFKAHPEYLGRPLHQVPCPFNHCESYGKHYADELLQALPTFGINTKIIWSHELYQRREMKNLVRVTLENVEKLREIFREVVGPTLQGDRLEAFNRDLPDWFPCLVLCEKCGRLKTTRVDGYRAEGGWISYSCGGCGHRGEVAVEGWPVKLRWRVDWPAKWALFKVSCEPAGKDHSVKGGAYDTGEKICREVFGRPGPLRVPYEWILLGDKAMKTHRGISFTFKEWLEVAPPETLRYLILREDPRKHISFHPENLPQLLDEFERTEGIFYGEEEASNPQQKEELRHLYPLILTDKTSPPTPPQRLPYRFAVILSQLEPLLGREGVERKGFEVMVQRYGSQDEKEFWKREGDVTVSRVRRKLLDKPDWMESIKSRIKQAGYWVEHYAKEESRFTITPTLPQELKAALTTQEREALRRVAEMLEGGEWDEKGLQFQIFEVGKTLGLKTRIFEVIYRVFLGRKFGPRLAPFLLSLEKGYTIKRLREAASGS